MEDLNAEWSKVSQDLYNASQQEAQAANAESGADPTTASNKKTKNDNDNVENVDYEVVDDEKDK